MKKKSIVKKPQARSIRQLLATLEVKNLLIKEQRRKLLAIEIQERSDLHLQNLLQEKERRIKEMTREYNELDSMFENTRKAWLIEKKNAEEVILQRDHFIKNNIGIAAISETAERVAAAVVELLKTSRAKRKR